MKKALVLILIILFIWPYSVLGLETEEKTKSKDIYIEWLEVEDFELSPKFNKYQNLYTIITDEYVYGLIITYKEEENQIIDIIDNEDFIYGENTIKIVVRDLEDTKENIYTIILTIEDNETILTFEEFLNKNEEIKGIGQKEVSMIVLGGFCLIMFFYRVIFVRK